MVHGGKRGVLAMTRARAGGPDMSGTGSGSGSPGTAAPCHAQGRQGKREKGESGGRLAGGPAHGVRPAAERKGGRSHCGWTGPEERAQLARKEREKAAMRSLWGLNYKTNFDINFKSVPTWFESKPIFPTQKNQNKIWL
jgi:hypothetical protein